MKPVQKAVKEVSKTISASPLYHQAVRPPPPPYSATSTTSGVYPNPGPLGFAPNYAPGSNAFHNSNSNNASFISLPNSSTSSFHSGGSGGGGSGYVTPVPATPLSAALGPAAQATLATNSMVGVHDYLQAGFAEQPQPTSSTASRAGRSAHERVDTVMQPPPPPTQGPGRRGAGGRLGE